MSKLSRIGSTASCLGIVLLHPLTGLAATRTVANCSDAGAGSLRAAIAAATHGDTIAFDMPAMNCSKITLTSGEIAVGADLLTIQGPGSNLLTISGGNSSRVLLGYFGAAADLSKLTINDVTISNGFAAGATTIQQIVGGCIASGGDVDLSRAVVKDCVAQNSGQASGGAIWSNSLHLQHSTITGNQVFTSGTYSALGGGAFVRAELLVSFSTISGNSAPGSHSNVGAGVGGGIAVFAQTPGNVRIEFSTISGNTSDFGGGVYLYNQSGTRTITVDHSTVSDNQAVISGGGFHLYDRYANSGVVISDSTISSNLAGLVAGVFNSGPSMLVRNSTIAFNSAQDEVIGAGSQHFAAGLYTSDATLQSTIIAKNVANTASDLSAMVGSPLLGANNLIMAVVSGTTPPAGTLVADPMLGLLADNGGPTFTRALLNGSPAIATGNNSARLSSDQRGPGFARSTNGKTDIGAFQTGDGIFFGGFD